MLIIASWNISTLKENSNELVDIMIKRSIVWFVFKKLGGLVNVRKHFDTLVNYQKKKLNIKNYRWNFKVNATKVKMLDDRIILIKLVIGEDYIYIYIVCWCIFSKIKVKEKQELSRINEWIMQEIDSSKKIILGGDSNIHIEKDHRDMSECRGHSHRGKISLPEGY